MVEALRTIVHPAFNLDILLYPEEGKWAAHCLQLDIVEIGDTAQAAEDSLAQVITAHIESAIEDDDIEHLLHAAPREIWEKYLIAKSIAYREIPIRVYQPQEASFLQPPTVRLNRAESPLAA